MTPPQWAPAHADGHHIEGRPAKIHVPFPVKRNGTPSNILQLLRDTAHQVNQQLPFAFEIRERRLKLGTYFTFVPTQNRDANGMRQNTAPYLNLKFSIPKQTASTAELASTEMGLLSRAFRAGFTCCQPSLFGGQIWGTQQISYGARNLPRTLILQDLLYRSGDLSAYARSCGLPEQSSCFIQVDTVTDRRAAPEGVCATAGESGY